MTFKAIMHSVSKHMRLSEPTTKIGGLSDEDVAQWLYRARQKVIPWEKFDISGIVADFSPSLQRLQVRMQATYPANFIRITVVV